jgi:hypothetical protein
MPRSFDMSADYDGSVEDVLRAFRSTEYWLARLDDSAVDETKLESLQVGGDSGNDGTIDVATSQIMHSSNLPGVITQVHRGDLCIRREEHWAPVIDGVATASVSGFIAGAPATVSGSAELSPVADSGGSRLNCRVTVQVRIPLIGGKLEQFIGARLADLVALEQRFTTTWIADHP